MNTTTTPGWKRFLAVLEPHMLQDDLDKIRDAYELAKGAHAKQMRDSGERYFNHPVAVAMILIMELNIRDAWKLIVAALLHDTVEDSWLLRLELIKKIFGRMVALWVKQLTKIPKEGYHQRLEDACWQVLLIKLCDVLHNLRTLGGCTPTKRARQVKEVIDVYLPLANRLCGILPKKNRWWGVHLRSQITALCDKYTKTA